MEKTWATVESFIYIYVYMYIYPSFSSSREGLLVLI